MQGHKLAMTLGLAMLLSGAAGAQTDTTNTDSNKAAQQQTKADKKADKAQAKADRKEEKALKSKKVKDADKAQDKANRQEDKAAATAVNNSTSPQ